VGADFRQVAGGGTPADCTSATSLAAGASCNLSISFTPTQATTLTETATLTNNAMPATQSITLTGTGLQAAQTITFTTNPPASAAYNGTFTVTATGGASGKPVTFTSSGSCSNVAATYTITSGSGTCSVIANQDGNTNYAAAAAVTKTVSATPAAQTITFTKLPSSQLQGTLTLTATASSHLAVNFVSLTPSICSVSGTTATLANAGSCGIQAVQAGNSNYAPAPAVSQSVSVIAAFTIKPNPASETIYAGNVAAFVLQLQAASGFTSNVTLSCSGGPAGSYCVDFPMTVHFNAGKAQAVSGILFPAKTKGGVYTITFSGLSGTISDTATATFTVKCH
jgi:hypothetical protein